jgi:hypothetical protein
MGVGAMVELINDMDKFYDELIPMFDLPRDEFKKKTGEWEERVIKSANPLIKLLMPALASVYDVNARTQTQDLMVYAAITLKLEGKEKFNAIQDPHGDGPFALEQNDEAWEIKSKLVAREQPVSLKFVIKRK